MSNTMFSKVALRLISGEVVCEFSTPDMHEFLCKEVNRAEMDAWLGRIGRAVLELGSGYYVRFLWLQDDEAISMKKEFDVIVNKIDVWVDFICKVRATSDDTEFFGPGSVVNILKIADSCQSSESMIAELRYIAEEFGYNGVKLSAHDLTKSIMQKVCQYGYAFAVNEDKSTYKMTAKIALIDPIVEFISALNEVPVADDSVIQGGLFS